MLIPATWRLGAQLILAAIIALALLASSGSPRIDAAATAFAIPPSGGFTLGMAGTSDPAALAAAQRFDVEAVWVLDPASQRWLVYVPGAPAKASTLTSKNLRADSIVTIRRRGPTPPASPLGLTTPTVTETVGEGNALAAPQDGGFVQGLSGTNDPATLAARQPFPVGTIAVLDVATQRWLTFVPGAPASVNTLQRGVLRVDSIVTIRRATTAAPAPAAPAPAATPAPSTSSDTALPAGLSVNANAEAEMLGLLNAERTARGLHPLVLDTSIVPVARAHSTDMWVRDYFAHTNPDGLDPFQRMRAAGITFGWGGENLVKAQTTQRAHELLMNSPGHRANILNPNFRKIGIGSIQSGSWLMFTQNFTD